METRQSHAYMAVGPAGPAREAFVRRLAAGLLCPAAEPPCGVCRDCRKVLAGVHPDVIAVGREDSGKGTAHREILVDQIRRTAADAAVAPNEAVRKVYIIDPADRMNRQAQNALLKVLEEPPGHACFILCAEAADSLLETVRSRCVRVDAGGRDELLPAAEEPGAELAAGYLAAAASGDAAETARFCLLRAKLSGEETEAFLRQTRAMICEICCARQADPGLGRERLFRLDRLLEQMEDYLRHNVSPKQIFGVLAAATLRLDYDRGCKR